MNGSPKPDYAAMLLKNNSPEKLKKFKVNKGKDKPLNMNGRKFTVRMERYQQPELIKVENRPQRVFGVYQKPALGRKDVWVTVTHSKIDEQAEREAIAIAKKKIVDRGYKKQPKVGYLRPNMVESYPLTY